MTGKSIKYLCAILNSKLTRWFFKQVFPTLGYDAQLWGKASVQRIPIPKIPEEAQRPFVELVNRILKTKATSPSADTSKLEREIDRLLYSFYGLTSDEISSIEKASK